MPSWSSEAQSSATIPASTRRVTSGASEKATTSAGRPDSTARDCSPELPYDWEIETPSPSGVFAKAGISSA